jgi:multidrug/hemolysin transport system ATP-binding protein
VDPIITVKGLKKSYGDVQAVCGIDFSVEKGSFFAFLGPNGAGKSTTIEMLCSLLEPDEGFVGINGGILGRDNARIRSSIGVVFQDNLLDRLLTVRENLLVRGSLYRLSGSKLKNAVEHAATVSGVTDFLDRPYGKLSGGQRRRADIARSLVHTPQILFLDEPTTGLDPQTRKRVWETVCSLQSGEGMTVFLTTHYMEEAEKADYVTVIDHGRLVARGTPDELKQKYASDYLEIYPLNTEKICSLLQRDKINFTREQGGRIHIPLETTMNSLTILETCKPYIQNFEVRNGTMDDVFIRITGEAIRE